MAISAAFPHHSRLLITVFGGRHAKSQSDGLGLPSALWWLDVTAPLPARAYRVDQVLAASWGSEWYAPAGMPMWQPSWGRLSGIIIISGSNVCTNSTFMARSGRSSGRIGGRQHHHNHLRFEWFSTNSTFIMPSPGRRCCDRPPAEFSSPWPAKPISREREFRY